MKWDRDDLGAAVIVILFFLVLPVWLLLSAPVNGDSRTQYYSGGSYDVIYYDQYYENLP